MASLFLNREGNLSVFKLGIASAVLGGLFLVGAVVLSAMEVASFKSPLDLNEPAGTQLIVEEPLSPVSSRLYYSTTMDVLEVAAFYDAQLAALEDKDVMDLDRERCIRSPRDGNFSNYSEGNGVIPYEYRCLFQQVSLAQGVDRSTLVIIQPGIRNDETGMDNTDTTRIEYEQYWQP